MTLNPQTANFPPIDLPERSWSNNLRAALELLAPGSGVRAGLKLGVPLNAGQPTTGLKPTLTDGYLVQGDTVLGPYGSKLSKAAPASVSNRSIFFGLGGLNYGDANNVAPSVRDVQIGSISTNATSIIHIGQPYNYGAGRFGVRGLVNLATCPRAADTTFFTWTMPDELGHARVTYAEARVIAAVTANAATNDDFVLKVKNGTAAAVTLATLTAATHLGTVGTQVNKVPVSADALGFYEPTTIAFQYNQTDAGDQIATGLVEVIIELAIY
ncbi:MAG: hypothetical protein ACO3TI_06325 [Aquiluna sp.]